MINIANISDVEEIQSLVNLAYRGDEGLGVLYWRFEFKFYKKANIKGTFVHGLFDDEAFEISKRQTIDNFVQTMRAIR